MFAIRKIVTSKLIFQRHRIAITNRKYLYTMLWTTVRRLICNNSMLRNYTQWGQAHCYHLMSHLATRHMGRWNCVHIVRERWLQQQYPTNQKCHSSKAMKNFMHAFFDMSVFEANFVNKISLGLLLYRRTRIILIYVHFTQFWENQILKFKVLYFFLSCTSCYSSYV